MEQLTASTSSLLYYAPKLHSRRASWRFHFNGSKLLDQTHKPALNRRMNPNSQSLVVKARDGGGAELDSAALAVDTPKLRGFQVLKGNPTPFGATAREGGVNFAVYSGNAVSATLCLFTLSDLEAVRIFFFDNTKVKNDKESSF